MNSYIKSLVKAPNQNYLLLEVIHCIFLTSIIEIYNTIQFFLVLLMKPRRFKYFCHVVEKPVKQPNIKTKHARIILFNYEIATESSLFS